MEVKKVSRRKIIMSAVLILLVMAVSSSVIAQSEMVPEAVFDSRTRNIVISNVKGSSGIIIVFSPSYDKISYENIEYFGTAKADEEGNITFIVPPLDENVPYGKYVCKIAITDADGINQYSVDCYYPWAKPGISSLQKFWYEIDDSGNVTATVNFNEEPAEPYKMILAFYKDDLLEKVVCDDTVENLALTVTATKDTSTNMKAFLWDTTTLEPVIINLDIALD